MKVWKHKATGSLTDGSAFVEIKFRVWDGEKMHPFEVFGSRSGGQYAYDQATANKFTNMDIMQFTGLTDAEGTEIYESDLVHSALHGFDGIVHFKRGGFWVYEHETNVDEGVFGGDLSAETQWSIDLDYRVIGNIYEQCLVS